MRAIMNVLNRDGVIVARVLTADEADRERVRITASHIWCTAVTAEFIYDEDHS